jgi:hypothetical protein
MGYAYRDRPAKERPVFSFQGRVTSYAAAACATL